MSEKVGLEWVGVSIFLYLCRTTESVVNSVALNDK